MTITPFILASSSPRRLSLLADIGIVPDRVLPADIDESPLKGEVPRAMAKRLAFEKGAFVATANPDALVLSADTVVAVGRRVLPKAETPDDVRRFLQLMSGRRHRVFTAVALFRPHGKPLQKCSESIVTFKLLSEAEIEDYCASGEGIGKAGGYAIQGRAACLIRAMAGSYSGIVGLPLFEVAQLLKSAGGNS
ncbi:MAG TPA: septum formation protein Maf [Rhodospirillaceae bacterium]|nr:septum formation protein Maf [Rhodospirillaceae bacterium]